MLIDEFLPDYQIRKKHQVTVQSSPEETFERVRLLDISQARFSMMLFRFRGLSASEKFTLKDFLKMRFVLLGEKENEELLLGLAGQFWTPTGKLHRLDPDDFRKFDEPGNAKAVWNFSLKDRGKNNVVLETETRIQCLDETSWKRFRLYWLAIGSFSGLIRREILWTLKRQAEFVSSKIA